MKRVIQDHEDLKDLCIHGEPRVSVVFGRNTLETMEYSYSGWDGARFSNCVSLMV